MNWWQNYFNYENFFNIYFYKIPTFSIESQSKQGVLTEGEDLVQLTSSSM